MFDPDDEKPTDLPAHQYASLGLQLTAIAISLIALMVSCGANRNTIELARQSHLPIWECTLDEARISVVNRGGTEKALSVDAFAIFTTAPQNSRGIGSPQMFLMPDYYGREERRYDGDRLVMTLSTPSGGAEFAGRISGAIQRAMTEAGAAWGWIETESYVRIECKDLLGVKMEQFYARDRRSWSAERITEDRWRAADRLRDSLRSAKAVILVARADSADINRVVQACFAAMP